MQRMLTGLVILPNVDVFSDIKVSRKPIRTIANIFKKPSDKISEEARNCVLGNVHTNPDILESATFSFRIRLPSTRIRRIQQRIRIVLNLLSLNTLRVDGEIFESGKKKLRIQEYPDSCGRRLRSDVKTVLKCLHWADLTCTIKKTRVKDSDLNKI